ncbi:MAG TPA: tripartite tricarboxylate transporter substrate-binding protein [Bacillus sp. (in: firmicutes)]|uniref:tripartite tricarboxylate transporter substrate binding protein n=1 Tax=Bacillus litorisediminis TaxID=2922713 RepID=UPI001FACFBC5|nr:tripartite tricarboxylate transporter substrate-binding protein [Bacillus litorisediminis]HWO77812.1 tripartite tricarboxylate transporter substrate-binding protein [Bacillus sp. (in: firmicutes)]
MKFLKSKWSSLFIVCLSVLVVLVGCSSSSSGGTGGDAGSNDENVYSDGKPVTLVAPASPGSGWDLTARALVEVFTKEGLVDFPVPVVNEAGATGAVSLSQLVTAKKGAADKISVTSTPIMSNYLRGLSEYSYEDVTMIARLMTEYYTVVVPKDSKYQTIEDLLNDVKADPKAVAIGASGDDQLPFALLVDAVGGDASSINFISYEGGGEITNALLNGDLAAAMSGISEFTAQIEAGEFRALVVTSEERLGGVMQDVPTAIEQGIDVTFGNWRGLMGPPDMPEEAVTYWANVIEKALQTDTWKDLAKKNQWETTFMKGEEFQNYLNEANEAYKQGLEKTGQLKR